MVLPFRQEGWRLFSGTRYPWVSPAAIHIRGFHPRLPMVLPFRQEDRAVVYRDSGSVGFTHSYPHPWVSPAAIHGLALRARRPAVVFRDSGSGGFSHGYPRFWRSGKMTGLSLTAKRWTVDSRRFQPAVHGPGNFINPIGVDYHLVRSTKANGAVCRGCGLRFFDFIGSIIPAVSRLRRVFLCRRLTL
jgi:hypothetical protein